MNWKVLIAIVQIANQARTRFRFIQVIIEILRQFDRSLAKTDGQPNGTGTVSAGFVYVIRDKANGERFKTGYRAQPPWRNSQLRVEMGESGDFVLIIPAKDAKTLETKLRRSYARGSRRGAWFTLDENKRREILIVAALVIVAAGDELGMSPVDEEVVKLAKNLLTHLKGLAAAMWANTASARTQSSEEDGASESEPDVDDFSAIPEMDWEWESVLDENYRDLPKAKGRSGYICIIRDNDARRGKIFFDNHPVESIEAAFLERPLRLPLEIVMILKVDKIKRAVESLLSPSERKDGTEWVELTQEELGEYRQSAKGAFGHGSLYLGPRTHWVLETLDADNYRDFPKLKKTAGYICVVQGVNPGSLFKIWETSHPKGLVDDRWQSRELNNLHDMLTARKPIKFHVILKGRFAESFREFLQERYHERRRHQGWFELDDAQLEEIQKMGHSRH
ncbi:MAG: hypothetical protein OXG78_16475 [Chloroflexi bacterium]|nr:hypothetical protein [Chloroflexota bacterium]